VPAIFEVSTLLMVRIRVIWVVMSSGGIIDSECFEGKYCLQKFWKSITLLLCVTTQMTCILFVT
jgi:hypothetical protein